MNANKENPALPILRNQLDVIEKNIKRLQEAKANLLKAIEAIKDLKE